MKLMKLRWSVLLLSGALLFGCGQSQSDNPAFKPVLNPNPKYFVTYKGFIDPSLHHVVKLTFVMEYYSTNPKCEKVVNRLEGVSVPRVKLLYTQVKPDKKGYYYYKVATDRYQPGFCNWQAISIDYTDDGKNPYKSGTTLAMLTTKSSQAKKVTKQTIDQICDTQKCRVVSWQSNLGYKDDLLISGQHLIQFNYRRK